MWSHVLQVGVGEITIPSPKLSDGVDDFQYPMYRMSRRIRIKPVRTWVSIGLARSTHSVGMPPRGYLRL